MEILNRDIEHAKTLVNKNVKGASRYLEMLLKYKSKIETETVPNVAQKKGPWKVLSTENTTVIPDAHAQYEAMKNEALLQMDLAKM